VQRGESQAQIDLHELECTFREKSDVKAPKSDKGILIHGLLDLFNSLAQLQSQKRQAIIRCSYFEIYNDQLYDLLD
jgi:hypothetical protein